MNEIVCQNCGTPNQPDYTFCKRCGLPLKNPSVQQQAYYPGQPAPAGTGGGYQSVDATVDGIPVGTLYAFVGSNADKIVGGFLNMERTGKKTSWNWPVFLTTFLLGPLFSACWFFHRKIYKSACWLILAGLVLTVASFAVSMPFYSAYSTFLPQIFHAMELGNDQMVANAISDLIGQVALPFALLMVFQLIRIVFAVILAIYANYIYRCHAVEQIHRLETLPQGLSYESLRRAGSTNVAAWIIYGLAIFLLNILVSSLLTVNIMNMLTDFLQIYGGYQ